MIDEDRQSDEEIAAATDIGSPAFVVHVWAALLFGGNDFSVDDFDLSWPLLTVRLRRQLLEAWVDAGRDSEWMQQFDAATLAATLLADASPRRAWEGFAEVAHAQLAAIYSEITTGGWGYPSRPRLIAPDVELVVVVKAPPGLYTVETEMLGHEFVVAHSAVGWRIDAFRS